MRSFISAFLMAASKSANGEFDRGQILRLQRMAGLVKPHCGTEDRDECPLWAECVGQEVTVNRRCSAASGVWNLLIIISFAVKMR